MSLSLSRPSLPAWPEVRPVPLAEQLLTLRRRWRLIFCTAILVPSLAFAVLSLKAPRYTATGILLYDPAGAAPPGDNTLLLDDRDEDAIVASQSAIITSLPASRAIAAQLNLAQNPAFNPALRPPPWPPWLSRFLPEAWRAAPERGPDSAAIAVRQALRVAVLPNSRILAISFTSCDPDLAAAAANLAMQLYLTQQREQGYDDLATAQTWIEAHAETLQARLDQTETELAKARAAAGVVTGTQGTLTSETASRLAASLVDARANLAMAQARMAAAAGDSAAANAAIAPNLLPLRKEQADLAAQVQSLAAQYGAAYPDLVSARTQLAAITGEINAETARELDAAKAEVAADQAQVATLASALDAARQQSQAEDEETAPIRTLEQRADANRAMLQAMTLQAGQLAQQSALTKPDARIISAAFPPAAPDSLHRALVLAAASALGLCLGLLLAGLLEALDTSFRSGADIRAETGLTCLALVPETPRPMNAPIDAPFSLFAEQMRALRTGLEFSGAARVVAITAARPGEGKTTLAIALGRALAASGLRVVAIDGDIRQPSFDPVFSSGGAVGLTDHLAGLATMEEILQRDTLTPLQVIDGGTQGRDALSLFLSPALPELLDTLRTGHDVILLDVPPVFALAEARVLARVADATLLCIRWADTPRRVVRAAVTMLQEANVKLTGAVLTRVNAAKHGSSGFPDAEMYQPRYGGYFRG
jgi:capsular exopolysaccharide synthesis family protein